MSTPSEKLATDIKVLVRDAEELVKATAAETGDKVVELRQHMQRSVQDVKSNLHRLESAVIEKAKPTAVAADQYVRTHPWTAIGISAMAGLVVGLLTNRR
jgi:ElaB/YqjD/DUF883 family membrane-anchored ribosome-binding protein